MKGGYETAMGRTERDTEALFAKLSRLGIKPHLKGHAYLLAGMEFWKGQGRLPTAGELAGVCAVDSAHMERVLWMCAMLIEQRTGRRLKNADEVLSFVLKGE